MSKQKQREHENKGLGFPMASFALPVCLGSHEEANVALLSPVKKGSYSFMVCTICHVVPNCSIDTFQPSFQSMELPEGSGLSTSHRFVACVPADMSKGTSDLSLLLRPLAPHISSIREKDSTLHDSQLPSIKQELLLRNP